jgi:predicted nucleotide-binding protein
MRITVIEDDPYTSRAIRALLKAEFPDAQLDVLSSVSEFKEVLDNGRLVENAPDLIIVDMMLRWSQPVPKMPAIPEELQPYEMGRAGLKCLELLKSHQIAQRIPVVLHTMLTRDELREELKAVGTNVHHLIKSEDTTALVDLVRRLLKTDEDQGRKTVFLVHGHDTEAKETIARFVEHLGFKVTILNEQESRNRTIIKKFEDHANVAFAIVLLTPDDIGGSKKSPADLKPRARQNVIFELGYFIGKLGRHRVCALIKEDVEILSDYAGVVYVQMDSYGGWKTQLAREMKSANLVIDLSKLI